MPLEFDLEPGSPDWWLLRLGERLETQRPALNRLNAYDRGDHPLPSGNPRARDAFRRFQRQARSNFTGLVSEALLDRLQVEGFRIGGGDNPAAARTAVEVWERNRMDADASLVMRDALVMRRSYVIVGPSEANTSGVLITGEDPRFVIHEPDPTNRRNVRAALKTWLDPVSKFEHAVVYLPESVHYYRAKANEGGQRWHGGTWDRDTSDFEDGFAANPTAPIVPVVPFINRPDKDRFGFGEFEDVIDIQDRINQAALDRLTTGAAQAFRQRWATGVEIDDEQFDPGADLLWHVEDPNAKFGDFSAADIRMFTETIGADTELLASISRTPPYYLLGKMVNVSGDTLTAAESGLVAKARKRTREFGESFEQVQELAFRVRGEELPIGTRTDWAAIERQNEAAAADAALKKHTIGVPWRQLMEDLGYTPAQIATMESERASDAFLAALAGPAAGLEPAASPAPTGAPLPVATASPPAE